MTRLWNSVIGFVVAVVVSSSQVCLGEGKLHLILGGDTALKEQYLIAVTESQESLFRVLASSLPEGKLVAHRSNGDPSGKWLLNTIEHLRVDTGDCVLVYYVGHGSYDAQRRSHKLVYSVSPVYRDDVERELAKLQGPTLRCLITDSCATIENLLPSAPAAVPGKAVPSGLRRLFFDSKGFLNVNACDWGQAAVANYKNEGKLIPGGAFTMNLTSVLNDVKDSKTVTWDFVFTSTAEKTRKAFREIAPNGIRLTSLTGTKCVQRTQDPVYLGQLPRIGDEQTSPQRFTMGVEVEARNNNGVVVKELNQLGPAVRMTKVGDNSARTWSLLKGDVILQVGGRATDTPRDLQDALRLHKPDTWLKVMDGGTGETDDYNILLMPE